MTKLLDRDAVMAHYHSQFCEYDGKEDGADVCAGECREFAEGFGEGATPAIDRDVLTAALGWVDNALRNGSAMTRANLAFEVLCRQLGVDRDSLNTSDAAIERLRTALTGGAQ